MLLKTLRALAWYAILFAATDHAIAATITAFSRAAFQTALAGGAVAGQDFDSLTSGSTITTVNGVTYTASEGVALVTASFLTTSGPNGLGSTSVGFFLPGETATISFSAPIGAFAIDINTFATNSGDYKATLDIGPVVSSFFDVFPNRETGQFLGFVSDTPFSRVTIGAVNDPLTGRPFSYTLDTLVFGDAAPIISSASPEPSTWITMAAGILLLFLRPKFGFAGKGLKRTAEQIHALGDSLQA